jgi:tellurium resistance protein TerD
MASFKLEKGDKFAIAKAITKFRIGLGWDESATSKPIDIDAHAFGCVAKPDGSPTFYNDASHAVTYANGALQKNADKSFQSADGSIVHSGDNRTGNGAGDDESIVIDSSLLPAEITEISIFLTIHEAASRGQTFGQISNSFVRLLNEDSGDELARYDLQNEFATAITIQVGSLIKGAAGWEFKAIGAGTATNDLGAVLGMLS